MEETDFLKYRIRTLRLGKIFILIENWEGCSICSDIYLHILLHVAVTNLLVIALVMDRWFLQQKYRKIIWIQV